MTDHHVRLSYADDGQPLWSEWQTESIGDVGQYGLRVEFTRLGSFRNRVIRITCSSPRRRDVLGAVVILQPTESP
jgi:hypothetical protein